MRHHGANVTIDPRWWQLAVLSVTNQQILFVTSHR